MFSAVCHDFLPQIQFAITFRLRFEAVRSGLLALDRDMFTYVFGLRIQFLVKENSFFFIRRRYTPSRYPLWLVRKPKIERMETIKEQKHDRVSSQ
jgi:hypothetical protein